MDVKGGRDMTIDPNRVNQDMLDLISRVVQMSEWCGDATS